MERDVINDAIVLSVVDYTENPGPRYIRQGKCSGEGFYVSVLNKAFAECIKENQKLVINLDGASGYPSSFLDEAFGELVYDFSLSEVKKRVCFVTTMFRKRKEQVEKETYEQWEKKRKQEMSIERSAVAGTKYYYLNHRHELNERMI